MQNILQQVLGGGQQQQDYQGFVQRYEQGPPAEGYSNQEVMDRYQQVAPHLPTDVYQQSAEEAFARMSPQERQGFYEYMQQRASQQGVNMPQFSQPGFGQQVQQDPGLLGQLMGQMHQQQPGMLGQLLGGQGGSMLDNPIAKAALAGVAAIAVKKMMEGRMAA